MAPNHKPNNTEHIEVWQWNCRGFRRKQGLLRQYLCTYPIRPDIISLQEIGADRTPTLAGYYTIHQLHMTTVAQKRKLRGSCWLFNTRTRPTENVK
ncbi:hypothetical protein HPB49_011485 [Dermacentor silvarum]|uniref:Uncharacterized protein n=1 Tax=Dermacentor silvarum TaxID=543639 RepID=A0ACB8DZQ6_DERSI|nr:hypothetical protein HPB49_011485 [Dermacentor silvarum]